MSRIIPEKVQNKEMGIGETDDTRDGSRESFRSDVGAGVSSSAGAGAGVLNHPANPTKERASGIGTPYSGAPVGGPFFKSPALDFIPGNYSTPDNNNNNNDSQQSGKNSKYNITTIFYMIHNNSSTDF